MSYFLFSQTINSRNKIQLMRPSNEFQLIQSLWSNRTQTNGRVDKTFAKLKSSSDVPPVDNAMYHPSRYKIELCFHYIETGECDFGDRCLYAHSMAELRPCLYRHKKFKTELCRAFHLEGFCTFGSRCSFIHSKPNVDAIIAHFNSLTKIPMSENAIQNPIRKSYEQICSQYFDQTKYEIECEAQLLPSPFIGTKESRLRAFANICPSD